MEPQLTVKGEVDPIVNDSLVRHEKHYYEDGNIIFIAKPKTIFRLYRGLLARHSEVMAGMFRVASDQGTSQTTIDDVPAVKLDDEAEDWSHLLDFLLTPNVPPYPPPSPDFESLISVLKISSKYMFDTIRDSAVWHLRATLPKTLEDFIENPGLTMYFDTKAAQVVSVAREYDLPEFLPLALYAITTYAWRPTDVEAAQRVYCALPPDDLARTVVGRTRIHFEALKLAYKMHEHGLTNYTCAQPITHSRTCAKGRPEALWLKPEEALDEFLRNPLRQLVIRDSCEFHGLCKPCAEAIRARMASDLQALYDKLPEIFQLPSYDQSQASDDQSVGCSEDSQETLTNF
ncbi:hypothetical protein M407DRAFT_31040 [Tulasnella calospora MUT 4182]|uniref:BTB domain-containing protein n=1 Tax=Tulasnella calospora MUT 4182 TaxID=1051891 RepID=A0A0C3Q785_9AGAM|nr:hypothetical protein M407DRAFT_31040 [Tulasnella calospora MUT 4182]